MKSRLTSYEIIRHGIEHSDYFQGCGTSFTEFENVVTGIGDTEKEAFEDALEMLATGHSIDDASMRRLEWDLNHKEWSDYELPEVEMNDEESGQEMELGNPPYWHVSIRYNVEETCEAMA